ncbi:MAG: 30S ribosome-binding factor RbfA [Hyphomicrobiales bacterium]|nr:30S ribosome-binding factor RbfA [Hyphomicrobiales bacterium]
MRKSVKDQARGPSQRQLRVGETIRHALAEALQREAIADSRIDTRLVTVPEVRMSPDLKLATCYIMPLGGRLVSETVALLERNAKFLRGAIARRIAMKFMPELRFRADDSFERGHSIDRLLESPEVRRDTEAQDKGNAS